MGAIQRGTVMLAVLTGILITVIMFRSGNLCHGMSLGKHGIFAGLQQPRGNSMVIKDDQKRPEVDPVVIKDDQKRPEVDLELLQGSIPNDPLDGRITADDPTRVGKGFILTLNFTAQQTAAAMALIAQQCWLHSFNLSMNIVEPFASRSYLVHNKQLWTSVEINKGSRPLRFGHYYDLESFNQQSGNEHPVVVWEDFLHQAPRNIIAVKVNFHDPKRYCLSFKHACPAFPEHPLKVMKPNDFWRGCKEDTTLDEALSYLRQQRFTVVREVCLNCAAVPSESGVAASISAEDVHKQIFGEWDPGHVTVVLDRWYYRFNFRTGCGNVSILPYCQFITDRAHEVLLPSQSIHQSAEKYIQSVLQADKMVGVMIRLEWLLAYSWMTLSQVKQCVQKAVDALETYKHTLQVNSSNTVKPFVAMDIGKYGSQSFVTILKEQHRQDRLSLIKEMTHYMKEAIPQLYNGHWTFEQWEEGFAMATDGIEDSGYIAQVQGAIASQADCLVLMGGGNFQEVALMQYLKHHPNKADRCIKIVCADHKASVWKKMINEQ